MISLKMSVANLATLSDMLAGVKTPGALIAVGHFIGLFSKEILDYQSALNDIAKEEHEKSTAVGKEFFQVDENGNAIKGEDGQMVLVEGKTHDDFMTEYKKVMDASNERRIVAGNREVTLDVDANAFYRFKDEFYNNVDINLAASILCTKPGERENFTGVLYSIMTVLDAVHA